MPEDFVIARNPEEDSSLPYLLRIPYGTDGVLLKARETWPRTAKVYCHRVEEWPADVEIVERVPVRSCTRRGPAIDLVLDRGRENRSQFVMSFARGGRQVIFWQTQRTAKQARPRVRLPTARAAGVEDELEIVVDSHERYAWKFRQQRASTSRGALAAGDYGVHVDGRLAAAVERKTVADLVSSLTTGKLRYQLADLASLGRAAVVVEDRYSRVFEHKVVRGSVVADGLAECQVAFPSVPIVFCDNRKLAQEWAYRFLAAALHAAVDEPHGDAYFAGLAPGDPLPPRAPTTAQVRAWAMASGLTVSEKGRIPGAVRRAYDEAHAS
jgi:ERCC4 domain